MPWTRRGGKICKKKSDGSRGRKQTCRSVANAKAALRLLYMKMRGERRGHK